MFLADAPLTTEVSRAFANEQRDDGYVMNLSRLWAWRQDVQGAFADARKTLTSSSSLNAREAAVIVCATASTLRDSYCSIAWGARLATLTDAETAAQVLKAKEPVALTNRERALAGWARKVVEAPNSTSPQDVAGLRAAGLSDREIFEATVMTAFRLAFSTVNDALGAQPDAALVSKLPEELKGVVSFGRPPQVA